MPKKSRSGWVVLVAGSLLLLAACGTGTTTQIGAQTATTATTATTTSALKTVTYESATVQVPASWPVYDLTAKPHRCAVFNVHAVYLGHQEADAVCPTRALGKTEALQIEPDDAYAQSHMVAAAAGAQVNGLAVAYQPGGTADHQIVATFPSLGVVITATYGTDPATAQQVIASVQRAAW